ncbi:anaerobic glycerol-3-phosphate dehydrogenase subunit C|uniref:Glycerol-3-phosphate dehydrogenase subunit C n=1 Tax=Dendrosporobacter quercicolus TaxID=146817 RepID=A0A1G9XBY3_9FIRM|nr:anaerobic glycerol-3-phosphate dehydrogenase subunit C [Dendrosporobacter quercicolus]NSL49897.1 anaerobic glycerol-3-phosphate dehydrogenase subunit C [Dendrosporobacter quercicolus DSM 1736]SDM93823.1 glycerol-3-phosphate dehydrogenase subunit C [Dendrosporobacter quercicolus]
MANDRMNLDACFKCSFCNAVCPLLRVRPDYPGPKKLGSDIERFRREGIHCELEWADYCLGCGQCALICPNQVQVAESIAEARTHQKKNGTKKLRDYLFARPALLGKMNTFAAPVSNLALRAAKALLPLGGITANRTLPPYTGRRLTGSSGTALQETIVLFPGCFIQYNDPGAGEAAVKVLAKAGYRVEIARTACCGLPAGSDKAEMLRDAEHNVLALEDWVSRGCRIVTACTSCGHTLKAKYAGLFAADAHLGKVAEKIAASTYDLGELLADLQQEGRFVLPAQAAARKLAYHAPCHQKAQGMGKPWLKLLRSIAGLQVSDIDCGCCGMSGTYGFKQEKYDISMAIGQALFAAVEEYNPDQAVTECATCRLQIRHGTGYPALHPVEIVAQIMEGAE